MSTLRKILYPVLFLVFVLLTQSIFVVKETERAVKLRFGEIVEYDVEPGLHFKVPVVNTVRKFDARILTLDAAPQSYLTSEKKALTVDSFVKWRVSDVAKYYTTSGGDEERLRRLLIQRVDAGLRNEFGSRTVKEVVSGQRDELMDKLSNQLIDAGNNVEEKLWRMPLHKNYDKLMNSKNADMQNINYVGGAGSTTAAQFLQRFILNKTPWAHLDIAGMAFSKYGGALNSGGATGFGVRLLNQLVAVSYTHLTLPTKA